MTPEQIRNQMWEELNKVRSRVEYPNSNPCHIDYKTDWVYLGKRIKELGEQIEYFSTHHQLKH